MRIEFSVEELGPVRDAELVVRVPGLHVLYGSNVSGKTLLGAVLTSMLLAHSVVRHDEVLSRVVGEKGFLELAQTLLTDDPILGGVESEEEPVGVLREAWPNLEPWEALRRYTALRIVEDTLARLYALDGRERLEVDASLRVDGTSIRLSCRYPVVVESGVSLEALRECSFVSEGDARVTGVALLNPYEEYAAMYAEHRMPFETPSTRLVRSIFQLLSTRGSFLALLQGEALGRHIGALLEEFRRMLAESLRLSGFNVKPDSVRFEASEEGLTLRVGSVRVSYRLLSKGLRSFLSVLAYLVASLFLVQSGLNTLLYLDEPEASLDTYITFMLARRLASLVDEVKELAVMVSTHREDFIVSLEKLAARDERMRSLVTVYEMVYEGEGFRPVERRFQEDTGRFDVERISKLLDVMVTGE